MSNTVSSLDLTHLDDENEEIKMEEENITLSNKLSLFCANICNGPIY